MSVDLIKNTIQEYMTYTPLRLISKYKYKQIENVFLYLKEKKIKTAVLSDYFCQEKLKALRLFPDLHLSSLNTNINMLKPSPKGINYIVDYFKCQKKNVLYIGNSNYYDGESAKMANIKFLLLENKFFNYQPYQKMLKMI